MHGASVWLLSVLGVWSTAGANFIHGREICELVGEFVDSRIYISPCREVVGAYRRPVPCTRMVLHREQLRGDCQVFFFLAIAGAFSTDAVYKATQ